MRGGVKVIMITGDAETTAVAIGKKLGMPINQNSSIGPAVLRGDELDQMTEEELSRAIASTTIFARTSPDHKMKIVRALQARGDVVAMTGDGVNDAPALKKADIGISMGQLGTDVAKEAADMILVDDNFSTILPAVEEGMCDLRLFGGVVFLGGLTVGVLHRPIHLPQHSKLLGVPA